MHISRERFITTLQYPFAPPLPLLTDGYYPGDRDIKACAIFVGRTVDASITGAVRLLTVPLLTTAGAMHLGWDGMQLSSLRLLPMTVAGALTGTLLGLMGGLVSLCDVLVSACGASLILVWLLGHVAGEAVTLLVHLLGQLLHGGQQLGRGLC